MDLILVGDISGSVQGNERFISDAFVSFVDKFELSEEGIKIGIVLFNSNVYVINELSDNKEELMKSALSIRTLHADNNTFLSEGLISSLQEFSNNGRIGYRKMIVLVTDGAADDKVKSRQIVNQLNALGIEVCGILIASGSADPEFMKMTCGSCYVESDYENLTKELLKLDVCL